MVLDGKQNKSLRVLLEEGLVDLVGLGNLGFLRLFCLRLLNLGFLLSIHLLGEIDKRRLVDRLVLLIGWAEVDLLYGRVDLE